MLSRVAENLYWMSRYIERAETIARLLDVGFQIELDAVRLAPEGDGDGSGPVKSVLSILACRDDFEGLRPAGDHEAVLEFLTFDRHHGHSILAMIARARENARGTQEALSTEVWSQVNALYLYLCGRRARRRFAASPARFFDGVKRACILFAGLVDTTLPRTECYHFLQVGRYLERVNQVSRIVNVRCPSLEGDGPAIDPALRVVHWTSLLRCCSAYEAYKQRFREQIEPRGVVRYLVLDPDFPRALRFGVALCRESLHEIGGGGGADTYGSEAERLLGRLHGELRYLDVDELFSQGLSHFLTGVQEACNRIGSEIHQAYFFS